MLFAREPRRLAVAPSNLRGIALRRGLAVRLDVTVSSTGRGRAREQSGRAAQVERSISRHVTASSEHLAPRPALSLHARIACKSVDTRSLSSVQPLCASPSSILSTPASRPRDPDLSFNHSTLRHHRHSTTSPKPQCRHAPPSRTSREIPRRVKQPVRTAPCRSMTINSAGQTSKP